MQASKALAQRLREHVNSDGGWGYAPLRRSRVEPTAWALLALAAGPDALRASALPADFLRRAQTSRGLLADAPDAPPNYAFSALAALAVEACGVSPSDPWLRALTEAVTGGRGLALSDQAEMRQRNSLQAWPWIDGCFSWVEPTAWCLLLLKRRRARDPDGRVARRIDEAERLLYDRACAGGGWNYGNAAVLDQSLDPFVPTTALALLALQDRRDHPAVRAGVAWLREHAPREGSGMALAIGLTCLARYGAPTDDLHGLLLSRLERSGWPDQLHVTAMALYALAAVGSGAEAFRV